MTEKHTEDRTKLTVKAVDLNHWTDEELLLEYRLTGNSATSLIGQVPRKSGSPQAVLFGWNAVETGGITVRSAGASCPTAGVATSESAAAASAVRETCCLKVGWLIGATPIVYGIFSGDLDHPRTAVAAECGHDTKK